METKKPQGFSIEEKVLAEGREWMRKRYEEELQKIANEKGDISPLQREKTQSSPSNKTKSKDQCR